MYERSNEWKKVDKRRLKNCVNVQTYETILHERNNGPFKETFGETFRGRLISLECTNDRETLPTETRISREKPVERTKQVSYELTYDILLRTKF